MRNSIQACEKLWQAVLERALLDMSLVSPKPEKMQAKTEAQTWHIEHQNELEIVCDYAGLNFLEELGQFKKQKVRAKKTAILIYFLALELQARQDSKPIIFAQTLPFAPPATPQQISFLPQLLHGFQPTQFCAIKRKKPRIQLVQNLHQLELWA
jgi:hypothetical protein